MENGKALDVIVIGGRKFNGVAQELTAAQDHYLVGQLRLAGALQIIANKPEKSRKKSEAEKNTEAEKAAEALLTTILLSGRTSAILSGCLTEEGKKWTLVEAERNALAFDDVTDGESKRAMREALLGFVLGFFRYATASVATSQKSSNRS